MSYSPSGGLGGGTLRQNGFYPRDVAADFAHAGRAFGLAGGALEAQV
jgi:hypothetical protein